MTAVFAQLTPAACAKATMQSALRAALVFGVVGMTALLSACASGAGGDPGANKKDIVTESDEPETRKRARLRLELASGYFNEGKTTVALDEIKQALTNDPNFGEAFNLRGLIYMRLNDMRLAEDSFRRAIALNPRDANSAHNFGWMLCQQQRYPESFTYFKQALSVPLYGEQSKTLMAQGLCEQAAGQKGDAERSLARAYELDASNPIVGYNLASMLYERAEYPRAQFYIRRLNNGEYANAETLWLGIKVERRLGDAVAQQQLAGQLKRRFPQSREQASFEKGAFNE